MKILINCIHLLSDTQGAGGAGSYVTALVKDLAKLAEVRLLVHPRNFLKFQPIPSLDLIPVVDNDNSTIYPYLDWCDIYFCPLNELVPTYLDSKVPVASTILDLQHEFYPLFFKGGGYESRFHHYSYAIARANGIITISNHEKNLIKSIYPNSDVYVTYLSGYLADRLPAESSHDIESLLGMNPGSYIIYPAIPWKHKNHHRLIEAFYILKNHYSKLYDNLQLILTGSSHSLSNSPLSLIIKNLSLEASINILGFLPDKQLYSLIFHAKAMVFPSLYEGFGIPIVDAMKLGTPVIASRCTAIPEIGNDCIDYFEDPFDSRQIAQDLASFLENSDKLEQLSIQGIIKGNEYSSVNTAKSTLKAFQSILDKAKQRESHVDLTTVSAYSTFSKIQRLSIVLNCLNLTNINQFIDLINSLKLNCQIIPILNSHNCDKIEDLVEFRTLNLKCQFPIKPVYSFGILDSESELYSILNFTYDSVVSTKYVMYCSFDTLVKYCNVIDVVTPCIYLDAFSTLSAVKLCPDTNEPMEVQPLSGLALAEAYETFRNTKLKFFELTFLKSTLQSEGYHPGCFKYLSKFLSSSTYLKLPIRPESLESE